MISEIRENRILHVYGSEIVSYEEAISEAFSVILKLTKYPQPPSSEIHAGLRRVLADSALISLIFFPVGKKDGFRGERAKFLCEKFRVDDSSPLKSRALRNHIAHLDERFDEWILNSQKQTFGRAMLGSRADAISLGLEAEDILGIFAPKTLVFSFIEDDLRVDELVHEIRRISQTARQTLRNLPWLKEN